MSFPAISLRLCNQDGSYGAVLPDDARVSCDLTLTDGTANALQLTVDARNPRSALLVDLATVAVLVGGIEYPDMRFVLDDSGRDEVLEEDTVTWSALSVLGQLAYGIVLPEGTNYEVGGVNLGAVTPGKGLRMLIEKCQARGALTWLTLGFTDGQDSTGAAWQTLDGEFAEQGKTMLDVLENWHDRRVATARMQGTSLRLYRYGNQGVDRSQLAGGLLLRGRDLEDGPWNSTSRDARSVMYAYGELPNPATQTAEGDETDTGEGVPILVKEENASAKTRFGVREAWLSQQQVDSESQLRAIASGSLALTNRARDAYTYKLSMAGPLPLVDWSKGDVMQVRVVTANRQMRARAITINEGADGEVTGSVGFGDRMMDAQDELQRTLDRLTQMAGQSMDGGLYRTPAAQTYSPTAADSTDPSDPGADIKWLRLVHNLTNETLWQKLVALGYTVLTASSGTPQEWLYAPKTVVDQLAAGLGITAYNADESDDHTPPLPPSNLSASSFVLLSGDRLNQATIRLTWAPSLSSDVAWYEVGWLPLADDGSVITGPGAPPWTTMPNVPSDASVTSLEGRRPGSRCRFRVRAVDGAYNVSAWVSLDVQATTDTQAPTQRPSAPTVTNSLYNSARVATDGLTEAGLPFDPDDVRAFQVHASTAAQYVPSPATYRGLLTIVGKGGAETLLTGLSPGTPLYVKLVPVDVAGNVGDPASTCSASVQAGARDVFASGLPNAVVTPEALAFNDRDNLLPDGSFERAAWRQAQTDQNRWRAGSHPTTWTAQKEAATGFTQVAQADPAVLPITTWSAVSNAGGSPYDPSSFGTTIDTSTGKPRKTSGNLAFWLSTSGRNYDPTVVYRVQVQFRVLSDSTAGFYANVGLVPRPLGTAAAGRPELNYDGTTRANGQWYSASAPGTFQNPAVVAGGTYTLTLFIGGASNTAVTADQGSFEKPLHMPAGTDLLALELWLMGNFSVEVVGTEIRTLSTPTFDGQWVLDVGPGANSYKGLALLDAQPSKGDDVFYVVGRSKLLGPRSNQPTVGIMGIWRDWQGAVLATRYIEKAGGFTSDAWYQFEGRVSFPDNNPYRRTGQISTVELALYVYNVGAGQIVRTDALETRRAMTNVLIADLAVDDAKIKNLSVAKLTTGTLDAETVVGRTIRTAYQGSSLSTVGMFSRSAGGKGYAFFGAADSAGVTTVEINGEDGSAKFGGTITAAEIGGYIRSRGIVGGGYSELSAGELRYVGELDYLRTPARIFFGGTGVTLRPAWVHLEGTSANSLVFSEFGHYMVNTRYNNTASYDVAAVIGQTTMRHPYAEFRFTDQSFRGTLGRYPIMWIHGNALDGGAAGIGVDRDGSGVAGYWVDAVRTSDWTSASTLWCGLRANQFVTQSMAELKENFRDPDVSALAIMRDNPSLWWTYIHDEYEEWHWGPTLNGLPAWMWRGGTGLAEGDKIGLVWRGVEELVELHDDVRRRLERLEAA